MTKAYLFDYGGTLDTQGCHWGKVLWHAYERCQAPTSEENFRQAYVYGERTLATHRIVMPDFTFRQTLNEKIRLQTEYLLSHQLLPASTDIQALREDILNDVYSVAQRNTAASKKVLTQIGKNSPMVLVSNFYGNIANVLHEFALDGLFADIVESAVVGIRKPDPRIFLLGAERLGMKAEEITVVGDSYDKDIVPAHAVGFSTVWIKGEGWTDDEPDAPVADKIIKDLNELL